MARKHSTKPDEDSLDYGLTLIRMAGEKHLISPKGVVPFLCEVLEIMNFGYITPQDLLDFIESSGSE